MRLRALPIVGTMVLGVLLLSGLALGREGGSSATNGDDKLIGDGGKNLISGLAGADRIEGKGAPIPSQAAMATTRSRATAVTTG